MKNRAIIAALAVAAMVSCTKNNEPTTTDEFVAAKFTSAEIGTRTSGDSWEEGDLIGISMYNNGTTTSPLAENYEYSSDDSGDFTEKDDSIYYPMTGEVDFYAYYPYQSTMSDNIYKADISDQEDIGAIDFMTASIEGVSKTSTEQKFTFKHGLAMIKLNVTIKYSLVDISGTTVVIEKLNTTADFDALTGEIVAESSDTPLEMSMEIEEGEATADGNVESLTATLIVLPETMGEDVKVVFTTEEGEVLTASLSGESFTSGTIKSYSVELGYDYVTFFGSTLEGWSEAEAGDDLTADENFSTTD